MSIDAPFEEYSKARLPRGLSYVVGRDQVEQSLRAAQATVGLLTFGIADEDPRRSSYLLFDVYWKGDGGSRIFDDGPSTDTSRLLMRWNAVGSEQRAALVTEVLDRWLPEACSWAASAPARGNVWRASDHRWMLLVDGSSLEVQTL